MAFILGLVSIWVVVYLNIYWLWETPVEGLFYVRLFIIVLYLTILLVASVLEEQYLIEERMVLYKKIVHHSKDAIAIIDNKGYYLEQNPAHEKLVGYSDVELDGRTPEIHLGLEAYNTIAAGLSEKMQSAGEWVSHTKEGDKLIDLSSFSILNDENEVICHVGIQRDITERKKTENRLRESEAEAWSLFKDSAIPVMIEDFSEIKVYIDKLKAVGLTDWETYFNQNPDELPKLIPMVKIIDVNQRMLEFYGEGSKQKLYDNLASFFTKESISVFQKEVIALATDNFTFSSEIPIRNIKGEIIHLIISVSIPPAYREKFERVIVSFVDITEIKRAENLQKTLLDISNTANKAKDVEDTINTVRSELGSIIDTTNFFLALYNAELDEITLPFVYDENELPKKLPASKTLTSLVIRDKKALLLNHHQMQEMEARGIIQPIGTPAKIWLGVPLKIKGDVMGALVVQSYDNEYAYSQKDKETLEIIANQIALSIERKKAEEDILLALEKAQESDHIKSAFLASMSHELRTPLNAIIGFSNLIDMDMPLEQAIEFAEMIHKSGSNLLQIVDSIFEVSLIDEGVQKVVYGEHSLENLMNDVYQTILTRQKVLNKTEIIISMSHKAPVKQEVYSDDTKLKLIFLHLLSNALKFTKAGSIQFGLNKIDEDKQFHFFVSDTGIGIPKDKQAFIFDRFRMGDDTHNRQHEGMGIGLFICKKLVEMLGGRIKVDSDENKGSSFTFYLPLQTKK